MLFKILKNQKCVREPLKYNKCSWRAVEMFLQGKLNKIKEKKIEGSL